MESGHIRALSILHLHVHCLNNLPFFMLHSPLTATQTWSHSVIFCFYYRLNYRLNFTSGRTLLVSELYIHYILKAQDKIVFFASIPQSLHLIVAVFRKDWKYETCGISQCIIKSRNSFKGYVSCTIVTSEPRNNSCLKYNDILAWTGIYSP